MQDYYLLCMRIIKTTRKILTNITLIGELSKRFQFAKITTKKLAYSDGNCHGLHVIAMVMLSLKLAMDFFHLW